MLELDRIVDVVQSRSEVILALDLTACLAHALVHSRVVEVVCATILARIQRDPVRSYLTRLRSLLRFLAGLVGFIRELTDWLSLVLHDLAMVLVLKPERQLSATHGLIREAHECLRVFLHKAQELAPLFLLRSHFLVVGSLFTLPNGCLLACIERATDARTRRQQVLLVLSKVDAHLATFEEADGVVLAQLDRFLFDFAANLSFSLKLLQRCSDSVRLECVNQLVLEALLVLVEDFRGVDELNLLKAALLRRWLSNSRRLLQRLVSRSQSHLVKLLLVLLAIGR